MTILRRITLGYVLLLIFVVALVACGVWAALKVDSWSSEHAGTLAQVDAASTISEASANMVIYGMGVILAEDVASRTELDAIRQEDRDEVLAALADLALSEAGSEEDLQNVAAIRTAFDEVDTALIAAIELAGPYRVQAEKDLNAKVLPLATALDEVASTYLDAEREQGTASLADLQGKAGIILWVMIIVGVVAVIGGVVTNWTLVKVIGRQLRQAAAGIGDASAQLLAISTQVAAGAAQTSAATNETTVTLEEIKQTALLTSDKATQVAENTRTAAHFASSGQNQVEETIAAFERIQNQMAVVAEAITRLSEQTQAVGDIITTVSDLAEQSNLLSVNASIEAAKAGDQGKGFTVVAQEVKSLAEQSKQAVTQVRLILSEITKAGTTAVQAAQQGHQTIEEGRCTVVDAREGTGILAGAVAQAADSVMQISTSARQQLAGMEQVSQALDGINQAGSQSATGTREVEHQVKELKDLSFRLKRLVDSKATT
jgi:methyl-accepting chemotaxis protein